MKKLLSILTVGFISLSLISCDSSGSDAKEELKSVTDSLEAANKELDEEIEENQEDIQDIKEAAEALETLAR